MDIWATVSSQSRGRRLFVKSSGSNDDAVKRLYSSMSHISPGTLKSVIALWSGHRADSNNILPSALDIGSSLNQCQEPLAKTSTSSNFPRLHNMNKANVPSFWIVARFLNYHEVRPNYVRRNHVVHVRIAHLRVIIGQTDDK